MDNFFVMNTIAEWFGGDGKVVCPVSGLEYELLTRIRSGRTRIDQRAVVEAVVTPTVKGAFHAG